MLHIWRQQNTNIFGSPAVTKEMRAASSRCVALCPNFLKSYNPNFGQKEILGGLDRTEKKI